MKKPDRKTFDDLPDKLVCKCENCVYEDQSILQLGYVCVMCGRYADKRVLAHLEKKEKLKAVTRGS